MQVGESESLCSLFTNRPAARVLILFDVTNEGGKINCAGNQCLRRKTEEISFVPSQGMHCVAHFRYKQPL
jgi:hypothetical protein